MPTLVLLRHGESDWNRENRFTGWTDVDLSATGVAEAHEAGRLLAAEGLTFDVAYTSLLQRAIRTLWLVLDDLDLMWLPVRNSWRLNERHYGALQGLDKAETAAKYGDEQVRLWRRSYDIPPPALDPSDERFPGHDRRYADLDDADLPGPSRSRTPSRGSCPTGTTRSPRRSPPAPRAHRGAREQPACTGEVPRRCLGRCESSGSTSRPAFPWCTSSTTRSGPSAIATWATPPGSRRPSPRSRPRARPSATDPPAGRPSQTRSAHHPCYHPPAETTGGSRT